MKKDAKFQHPFTADKSSGRLVAVTPVQLIVFCLSKWRGVFIGDQHGDVRIPALLASRMPELVLAGVKTLFIEMFRSADQGLLDSFQDGTVDMLALERYLRNQGGTWALARSEPM